MKTKTVKNELEVKNALPHNNITVHFRDGSTTGIIIDGVHINSAYGLSIAIEQPYEEVERWLVQVTHPNFNPVNKFFESQYDANDFARPYQEMSDTEVTIEKAKVLIDEDGNTFDIGMTS